MIDKIKSQTTLVEGIKEKSGNRRAMATIDGDGDSDINNDNGDECNEIKIATIQKPEKSSDPQFQNFQKYPQTSSTTQILSSLRHLRVLHLPLRLLLLWYLLQEATK